MRLSKEPDTTSGGGGGGGDGGGGGGGGGGGDGDGGGDDGGVGVGIGGRDITSKSSGDDEHGMVTGERATKTRTFQCHVYRDASMSDVVMTMDLTCADGDDALVRNGGCLILRD
jgi:hypothetical protein